MSAFKTNSSQPVKVEQKSEVVFEVSKSQQLLDTARKGRMGY